MSKTHEQKFTNALRDIFVGAKIEGESGYINLMRIKSRYYTEGVFPKLMEKIENETAPFPAFREELFDKLYTFFKRYFSESGSIYFRHTPYYQDIYERIYTDDRDVMLFWKTQNLYYVKTDRLFQSASITLEDVLTFQFDASTLSNKRNNEKRNLVFSYEGLGENETLKFSVDYSKGATKTKTDDILKAIKKDGVKVNEDQLTRAFRLFERQSEVDFFINKNARGFLNEQFDLWMYQYLFKNDSTDWNETRIKQMQALKRVARAIIEFIAQFEDELVRIWNKPKFALRSNYVITFDRVFERSEAVARKLLAHEGIAAQIEEWRELGIINYELGIMNDEAAGKQESLFDGELPESEIAFNKLVADFHQTHNSKFIIHNSKFKHLPFDTKHFKSLETEILSLFDNLDEELDGRLIHSENYQALNTLKDKFREKVECIYIDPPYNAVATEIVYENEYKHASWLSLVQDRIEISKVVLSKQGIICITIDDYELSRLQLLLDNIFGESNHLATVLIRNNPSGRSTVKGFAINHEYALFYSNVSEEVKVGRLPHTTEQKNRYSLEDAKGFYEWENFRKNSAGSDRVDRPKQFFPLYFNSKTNSLRVPKITWEESTKSWLVEEQPKKGEIEILPKDDFGRERVWRYGVERTVSEISDVLIKEKDNKIEVYKKKYLQEEGTLPRTWWDKPSYSARDNGTRALVELFGSEKGFDFPKSIEAVKDSIRIGSTEENDFILDFFAGSGTTAHAVINLNREDGGRRKYILVEANDYFHTVILPRVKKVVFSDKWKDGKAVEGGKGTSHFCKYFALEQYEDTLRRASYINDSETDQPAFFDNPYESPFASYVFLRDKKMSDALDVDYEADKITVDFAKLYPEIDWAETLSCVKGKFIKTVTAESVTFEDGETVKFAEIDYRDILPLVWWDK